MPFPMDEGVTPVTTTSADVPPSVTETVSVPPAVLLGNFVIRSSVVLNNGRLLISESTLPEAPDADFVIFTHKSDVESFRAGLLEGEYFDNSQTVVEVLSK